jgi:nucleotide-binding universal stress UspA family protein
MADSALPGPILVATDGSPSARRAVELAVMCAMQGAEPLRILCVWTLPVAISAFRPLTELTQSEEEERRRAHAVVRRAAAIANTAGVQTSTTVRDGDAVEEICAEAESCDARLIVVGAHGRPARSSPIGSVSLGLLAHAPCPVLVLRDDRPLDQGGSTATMLAALPQAPRAGRIARSTDRK